MGLPPGNGATVDFVLRASRQVIVHCAGLPDDSCSTVAPLFCTSPLWLWGKTCNRSSGVCTCPGGSAAIRGGGESVAVGPEDTEVWLDFRGLGSVEGRAFIGDEPVRCSVDLLRTPEGLEDLPRGIVAARHGDCDLDGRFAIDGLHAGTWRLTVTARGEDLVLPSIRVRGDRVDLGDQDLTQGARIRGRVVDELTGAPASDAIVLVQPGEEGRLALFATGDDTNADGEYEVEGLPAGLWRITALQRDNLDPTGGRLVRVGDNEDLELDLFIGGRALADDRGFELVTGGAGELVVERVPEDSEAARAGLEQGDEIVGASLFGLDLSSVHPNLPRLLLHHWSGPGVRLEVVRDGVRQSIELD